MKTSRKGIAFVLLFGLPLGGAAFQRSRTVRLVDNSDWWSATRDPELDDSINPEHREFAKANFTILGVDLDETMFIKAAARLGASTIIERGDASTGRQQACYVSAEVEVGFHPGGS